MSKQKIMVIYETAGGGHYAAAKAIEAQIKSMYGDAIEVKPIAVRTATGSQRVGHLMEAYNHMLKIKPSYSNMGMRLMNSLNVEKYATRLLPKAAANLRKTFENEQPDLIISVFGVVNHVALEVLSELGWRDPVGLPQQYRPYVIWCTDLTTGFLRNWAHRDADLTIALRPEAADQLVDYGVPREKIHVLEGLPVNQKFLSKVPKAEARRALGMEEDAFTVLISMGGVAVGATYDFTKELSDSGLAVQVIVVCGRNERLKSQCEELANDPQRGCAVYVHGFTDQMPLLMDAADVLVGKPGPGTIAEAIAKELPMCIDATHKPMLQEAGNLALVVDHGLGKAIRDEQGQRLRDLVRLYMNKKNGVADETRQKLRTFRKDRAIVELITEVLKQLPGGPPSHPLVPDQA